MSLPTAVIEHLQGDFVAEARPFCFLVDQDYHLLDSWGDGAWAGLANLEAGSSMLDHAPYLLGALDSEPQKLTYVSAGDGIVMHLVTMPHERNHYCILQRMNYACCTQASKNSLPDSAT